MTSRISITDGPVRKRIRAVMAAYRTIAARDRARRDFLVGKRETPIGKEPVDADNRMYTKPDDYLNEHGTPGVNINKKVK